MGIDKSLTDGFPSVNINGRKYHYGRELVFGQYLVENAEYAKDYWCFDRQEDLLAFLVNLPESADRDAIKRRHPDWDDATAEERERYLAEHRVYFRQLMEEKQKAGLDHWFNVLCFDRAGYYSARPDWNHRSCDHLDVEVHEHDATGRGTQLLIELHCHARDGGPKPDPILVSRRQALKLSEVLIDAARYVEERE